MAFISGRPVAVLDLSLAALTPNSYSDETKCECVPFSAGKPLTLQHNFRRIRPHSTASKSNHRATRSGSRATSYVFCVRDVAISIVVYPPGNDTLPVRILTLMANGAPSLISCSRFHLDGDYNSAARCRRPLAQVRREPPVSKIDFRSVTKLYRDRRVVDAVSLVIELGERVVLFGPSGSANRRHCFLSPGRTRPIPAK